MYFDLSTFSKKSSCTRQRRKQVSIALIICLLCLCTLNLIEFRRLQKKSDQKESTLWYHQPFQLLMGEDAHRVRNKQHVLISLKLDTSTAQIKGRLVKSPYIDHLKYFNLHVDKMYVYTDPNVNLTTKRRIPKEINAIEEYFQVLKTSTGSCPKLISFGGEMTCSKENGTENHFDGGKNICMAKELQIENSVNSKEKCLVLSFGINTDTSFDEAIEEAGCEVFMFDAFNYEKPYFKKVKFLHFHQIALGTKRYQLLSQVPNNSFTANFDTLNNIIINHGLEKRLINVLKMDIEGSEWKVLNDLCSQPNLRYIGQIAVEVHSNGMLNKTSSEQLRFARYYTDILRCFEEKGFQQVSYYDTPNHKYKITDKTGTRHEIAGELLLVNSQWFNKDFTNKFSKYGFNFKTII